MSDNARIVQISVSPGGVPKRPVASARVTPMGVQGDAQRDRTHHGGPDRALCLFSQERIRALQIEGHPIQPGSIGENLTIEGIDWTHVTPGVCLRLGDKVLVEVTRYTSPCFNTRTGVDDRSPSLTMANRSSTGSISAITPLRSSFRSPWRRRSAASRPAGSRRPCVPR